MDEYVYRDAVINAIKRAMFLEEEDRETAIACIEQIIAANVVEVVEDGLYIERVAVEEMLENAQLISDGEYCGYCTEDIHLYRIPAIDVAKVKHGHWIDHHSGGSSCSVCKRWVPYSHHPKYCETCGACMDEDKYLLVKAGQNNEVN